MLERKDWSSEFDELVNRAFSDFPFLSELQLPRMAPFAAPAIDLYEKDGKYALEVSVPGYETKDINVEVNGNAITVSGTHKATEEKKDARYYRREVRSGSFTRSVTLPQEVDPDKVDATMNKGLLTIKLTPTKPIASKKIAIKGE